MKIEGLKFDGDVGSLPWRETRVEGVFWIPLHLDDWDRAEGAAVEGSDRARGGGSVLIRMDPGCGYPPHRHVGSEHVLVLRGSYTDEFGTHREGDFVHYAGGSSHGPVAGGETGAPLSADNPPCVLYATANGGVELL